MVDGRIGGAALAVAVALIVSSGCGSDTSDDFRGGPPPAGIELPDFELSEHSGAVTHSDNLRGNVVLITFLDTQCTEACPVIAGLIGQSIELLSPSERSEVVPLAISSDPDEDTPASVRAFLRRHRVAGILHYLVGTEAELRPVWDAFHVLPSADTGDDELHSAPVRLFDREGVWVATLHAGVDLTPANLAHDIRVALDS
jgi:cytochrome oxidase Cu insertion factor (SCO1/SenC/PrrC family)